MKRRAAAYGRYSSDKQREASIEDQFRNIRRWVQLQGDLLLDQFIGQDAAQSGASMVGRDGLQRLIDRLCVRPAPVDYLAVDDLSRLSRDIADSFHLLKKLAFFGIDLVGVSDGLDSNSPGAKMGFGMKALMNEFFLSDLKAKTHRGLEGQALKGFSAGGRCFGYRTKGALAPGSDPSSQDFIGKALYIFEPEAEVVQRIFALALQGKSLAEITQTLIAEKALTPDPGKRSDRSRGWAPSSVRVVLRNDRYSGVLTWNKREFVKDPSTGKRVSRKRPKDEVVVVSAPSLAIIEPALFEEVQRVLNEKAVKFSRGALGRYQGRTPGSTQSRYMLSGLLVCGVCKKKMSVYGSGKKSPVDGRIYRGYRCATNAKKGKAGCPNDFTVSQGKIETAVVDELRKKLFTPASLEPYVEEFRKAYAEAAADPERESRIQVLRDDAAKHEKKIHNLLEFIEDGASEATKTRLREAEAKLAELRREISSLEQMGSVLPMPPFASIIDTLRAVEVTLLHDAPAAQQALKTMLGELTLLPVEKKPDAASGETESAWAYRVTGSIYLPDLFVLVGAEAGKGTGPLGNLRGSPLVVAGTGFEPVTFGL